MARLLTSTLGFVLVGVLALASVNRAAPMDAGESGGALRGPGAWVRGKVERAERLLAGGDPGSARATAEDLLAELTVRRGDIDDLLDADTLDAVAGAAVRVRNAAIRALLPDSADARGAFVASVADGAVWSDWRWGVPASITLAQAILESDWGRSAPGNNLFGLKGEGPAGSVVRRVVEYRHGRRGHRMDPFRAYATPDDGVRDHGEILGTGRRYARARAASEDLAAFAAALTGTYATDPRYAGKLLRLIEKRQLDRYDWVAPAGWR